MTLPLSDCYVQVATPSSNDSFWGSYCSSKDLTQDLIEHFGGTSQWIIYPGCSDLPHARAKILAMFAQHPTATHLLKVDDDISWNPADVIRMINSKRDFIAGVGCKKRLPLEWCVGNHSEIDGKLESCAFKKTGDDLVGYPKSVGTGFVLITKQCALRMIHEYKDLMYIDQHDKQEITAVYDPIILVNGKHRVRHFDDFAFCYRWRKIGGVVSVFPDIHLKHRGSYVYEGQWVQSEDVKNMLKEHDNEAAPQA